MITLVVWMAVLVPSLFMLVETGHIPRRHRQQPMLHPHGCGETHDR